MAPGPQEGGAAGVAQVDDRRLKPDPRRAPVQDVADPRSEALLHVPSRRRAHVAEWVRARGGERHAGKADQAPEERMGGHPHGDARKAGGHLVGHRGRLREHEGERARPERRASLQGGGIGDGDAAKVPQRRDVDNQRVAEGPALCGEDPSARGGAGRVGGKPVDRLRRHRDEAARPQAPGEQGEVARGAPVGPGGRGHGQRWREVRRIRAKKGRSLLSSGGHASAEPSLTS